MIKALLLIGLLSNAAAAAGPLFRHQDGKVNQEFENVYQDIESGGSSVSVDPLSTSSATINTM